MNTSPDIAERKNIIVWREGQALLVKSMVADELGLTHNQCVDWDTCGKIFAMNLANIQMEIVINELV